ncbi:MAG: hypothetical protein AAF865_15245 [Pseudomonadota bacterium]
MSNALTVGSATAAGTAFLAAVDAYLGTGAAEWIIALCLADPDRVVEVTPLPMKHSQHAVLYTTMGLAFASLALFANWHRALGEGRRAAHTPRIAGYPVLAALSILAQVGTRPGLAGIRSVYTRAMGTALDRARAEAAFQFFAGPRDTQDLEIFEGIVCHQERQRIIYAAIDFTRRADTPSAMIEPITRIAQAMDMGPAEFERHCSAYARLHARRRRRPTLGSSLHRAISLSRLVPPSIRALVRQAPGFAHPLSSPLTLRHSK